MGSGHAELVASVAGWTAPTVDKYPTQKGTPKALEAGKRYYIEGIYADGTGGGNIGVGWTGPGIGEAPVIIAGQYLNAFVVTRHPAYSPVPANGTADVTSPLFQWTPGVGAVMHDVYFGTDPNFGPATFKGRQGFALYYAMDVLIPGAKYYWRVDEVEADGVTVSTGDVWTFTVRPLTALPNPYDGRWAAAGPVASWAGQNARFVHRVRRAHQGGRRRWSRRRQAGRDRGDEFRCQRYTRTGDHLLLARGCDGRRRRRAPGRRVVLLDVRSRGRRPGADLGQPDSDRRPESGQDDAPNRLQLGRRPDPNIPVDNFSVRFVAELNVPFTGKYTIYEASDDGARTFLNGKQIAAGWVDRGTTEDASAELDLVAGEKYQIVMEYYENGGGAAAFLRWAGPGIPKSIIPQGALLPPQMAFGLTPGDGAVDVDGRAILSWSAATRRLYSVYLSRRRTLVEARSERARSDARKPPLPRPNPSRGTTMYWKVDVVTADGTTILVWSRASASRTTTRPTGSLRSVRRARLLATFVQNGTYDIGTFGGDQTYEFVVRAIEETMTSLCLIGRLNFGDTKAGSSTSSGTTPRSMVRPRSVWRTIRMT
jgi:hypothetical protein